MDQKPGHTLLGFLREHQPESINNIAKVINPDLLLREDLEPALQSMQDTFYGLALNLDNLQADAPADEQKLRTLLADRQNQLNLLTSPRRKSDERLED